MNWRWLVFSVFLVSCAQKITYDSRDNPPPQGSPVYPGSDGVNLAYSIVRTAVDPRWLKDPSIHGLCSVSLAEGANLESPCQNVTVSAVDHTGKEVAKATVEWGKFRLSVERGQEYYLRVVAPLYKVKMGERMGPVKAGETIEFRVTKK